MIDTDDLELFASSVRRTLTSDPDVTDRGLAEVGWTDALREWGGDAMRVVFTEQGTAAATSTALDDVLCWALGIPDRTAVLMPPLAGATRPSVHGLASARARRTGSVVVVTEGRAVRVPLDGALVREIRGLDPDAHLLDVATEAPPHSVDIGPAEWEQALAAGRVALAFELIGVSRSMLAMAREHALTRVQFGQPIASFQAVQHRLVDALLAIDAAEAAALATAEPLRTSGPASISTTHAAMSKALAGHGARTTARHCQQVLAGIGFTAEHGFHRWFRRALLLDELLGSARVLTRDLGARAIAERRVLFDLPL